jgi:hypothetical protein
LARIVRRIDHAARCAGDLELVGLELAADELRRDRLDGDAERPAERAVRVLVNVGAEEAVSVIGEVGVERAAVVDRAGRRGGELAVLGIERMDGAQVNRTGDADRGKARIAGLLDHARADQLRGELVEFDAAVAARRNDLAAAEQGEAEVGAEAADRNLLRAAAHALGGDAGQAGKPVSDRQVGQQADVFGCWARLMMISDASGPIAPPRGWGLAAADTRVSHFSDRKHRPLTIDQFLTDPEHAISEAALHNFANITPHYPGVRAPLAPQARACLLAEIAPRLSA